MNIFTLFGISQQSLEQGAVVMLIVAVVLFFIFREVFTWYIKTTKIVSLLEQIEENTRPKDFKKVTEIVPEQKILSTPVKDQVDKPQRTSLDKWWNGPDKFNLP